MLTQRVTAAEALRAAVDALQGTAPLPEALRVLLAQVRAFADADEAYLLLADGDRLVLRAADGLPSGPTGRSVEPRGLEQQAMAERRSIVASDAGAGPDFVDHFGRPSPPGAFVAVPMLVRGQAVGVLVAARRAPGQLGGATLWWLELMASLAATAVAQDEAARFQERRARQAEVLLSLSDVPAEDPERFTARLADAISRGLGVDYADLLVHDPERGELVVVGGGDTRVVGPGGIGLGQIAVAADHPVARVFRTGEPLLCHDVAAEEGLREVYRSFAVRSVAAVPLRVGRETRGVLHLAARAPGAVGWPDLAFLLLVAARAGLLLEREDVHRRRAETRAREEFVGVVSHELKTPVAVTKAYVELLQRRAEREGRRSDQEVLGKIADENERMLAMVEELLDVQRIDAGVLHLELSRFDLTALTQRIAEGLQLTSARHRLVVDAADPVVVVADRRRIEEIVANLLDNAIKYSPEGGQVRAAVTVGEERGQPVARVEVADQGIGIAPEEQPRVFERFYRAGVKRERLHRGHHGLGLGLYIARELVHRHGGDMGVASEPGQGSTFWFWLPLQGPDPEA